MTDRQRIEDLLRESAPQVLAALVRRHGQFDACEDAVQEALLAAAVQWPGEGVPERPRSWLLTVASRALVDAWRADSARRRREGAVALDPAGHSPPAGPIVPLVAGLAGDDQDDALALLFLCCHPALSPPSQLALTLRAVGGLTTAQIAAAFLVPEATIAKRIVRAKQRIRDAGARFELPAQPQRTGRLGVVLHVLYLVFNEGYTTSSGPALQRADLTAEAIRLTRLLHRLLPGEAEVAGLLALMLLTDARRAARAGTDGRIVPLADQRRDLWDPPPPRPPTGRRSSRSTRSSPPSPPDRSSRSAAPSPSQTSTGPEPGSPCSGPSTQTSGWPTPTASKRYAPTCLNKLATPPPHESPTSGRRR